MSFCSLHIAGAATAADVGNGSNGMMSHDGESIQVAAIETFILTLTGYRWKNLRQNDLTLSSTYHYS